MSEHRNLRLATILLTVPCVIAIWRVQASGGVGANGRNPAQPSKETRTLTEKSPVADVNLIMITVDTLRADLLRHPRHVMPNLDALASAGVVFENAYAPASFTGRSMGPLLIGKYSSATHGDFAHFTAFGRSNDVFIQERLQKASIRTISVQGYWYFYQPQYGFNRGFDVVDSSASSNPGYLPHDRTSNSEQLADAILRQLAKPENHEQRLYLWSHFTDTHAEYVAHEGFNFGTTPKDRYFGEAAFVDHHIGRIVDWVRQQPWGKRTVFAVTSDHGEAFGEHGMNGHGGELWEPLIRVPLVLNAPGIEPRRVAARRSIIDLAPTILELMHVGGAPGSLTSAFNGSSLLPEMRGAKGDSRARPIYVDMAAGPYNSEREAYISGTQKLLATRDQPSALFDLSVDPEEKSNLLKNSRNEIIVGEYRQFRRHVTECK